MTKSRSGWATFHKVGLYTLEVETEAVPLSLVGLVFSLSLSPFRDKSNYQLTRYSVFNVHGECVVSPLGEPTAQLYYVGTLAVN